MCFQCGKLGHPKLAFKAKPTKDDNVTSKSSKSSKSGKSSSPSKDKKVMSAISKGFQKMGKAMSRIHKEDDSDISESNSEQSHAQICDASALVFMNKTESKQGSKYSFALDKVKMSDHLLLDNQLSVHVFCNREYVSNIRQLHGKCSSRAMEANCLLPK